MKQLSNENGMNNTDTNTEEVETQSNDEEKLEEITDDTWKNLLLEWKLDVYIENFQFEAYVEVDIWRDLTKEDCRNELKMKSGHIKKFLRLGDEYFKTLEVSKH